MKKLTLAIALAAAMALPSLAQAREVTFTTVINNYSGKSDFTSLSK